MKKHTILIFLCILTGIISACAGGQAIRDITPREKAPARLSWDSETHKWVFKSEPSAGNIRKIDQKPIISSFARRVPCTPGAEETFIELQRRVLTKEEYFQTKFKGKKVVFPKDLPRPGEVEIKYRIGIDDILNVFIWKHEDLSEDLLVRSDGYVSLPLIGDVYAAGLEIPEFKTLIEKKYNEYLESPQITVTCKMPNSLQVSVTGAIDTPDTYVGPTTMVYTLRGDHTLLTILSVVTILPNADLSESYIIRGGVIIPVDIKALWKDGDISQNILLCPGDTIVIPEPLKQVVLLGEFKNPGRYKVNRNAKILEAISQAGGFNPSTANLYMAYLARGDGVLPINFKRLLDQGDISQNILLHDDDIIYMPNINESKIYVLGEVNRPKVCYFTDPLDLMEAISSAGGFKDTANRSQVVMVRGTPQRPEVYAVNVLDMMKGKSMERFYLEKNDTVYIPRTAIANWNVFLSRMLPTLTTTRVIQEIVHEGWNP